MHHGCCMSQVLTFAFLLSPSYSSYGHSTLRLLRRGRKYLAFSDCDFPGNYGEDDDYKELILREMLGSHTQYLQVKVVLSTRLHAEVLRGLS